MLKANIKTNSKHIQKRYKRLQSKFPRLIEKGLLQAGFHLLEIIKAKTSKGLDYKGVPFAPYSQGYLKQLAREGKRTTVDLFYSGRMLGSLTPGGKTIRKTGRNRVSVNFSNSQMRKRALFNQVLNEPKREFFGFNQRTESIIQKGFNRFMMKQFKAMRI
tara:strand:- start:520 stop:999 length:480 start_codon:yes stop_codon:yes gene_type:complete